MRLELKDLPPRMRQQALKKIAEEDARRGAALKKAMRLKAAAERAAGADFDSRGEYEYYIGTVRPKMDKGEVVQCERQPVFELFEKGEYLGVKYRRIIYTADFRLEYADGTIEIVEVKSKFVRRMQRDYPLRRRLFIEKYARPNGWKFTEIITDETKDDIKAWKKEVANE